MQPKVSLQKGLPTKSTNECTRTLRRQGGGRWRHEVPLRARHGGCGSGACGDGTAAAAAASAGERVGYKIRLCTCGWGGQPLRDIPP